MNDFGPRPDAHSEQIDRLKNKIHRLRTALMPLAISGAELQQMDDVDPGAILWAPERGRGVTLGDLMITANALATKEAPDGALDRVIAEARRIAIRDVERMFSDSAVDAYDAMAMKHSDQLNSSEHMVAEMLDGEEALAKQEGESGGDSIEAQIGALAGEIAALIREIDAIKAAKEKACEVQPETQAGNDRIMATINAIDGMHCAKGYLEEVVDSLAEAETDGA